jgi:hypothetical protein
VSSVYAYGKYFSFGIFSHAIYDPARDRQTQRATLTNPRMKQRGAEGAEGMVAQTSAGCREVSARVRTLSDLKSITTSLYRRIGSLQMDHPCFLLRAYAQDTWQD